MTFLGITPWQIGTADWDDIFAQRRMVMFTTHSPAYFGRSLADNCSVSFLYLFHFERFI